MRLFHASPVHITNFHIPFGGLHFGGMESALLAVKVHMPKKVFVHKVEINTEGFSEVCDAGEHGAWQNEINYAKSIGDRGLIYYNKYERDFVKSVCIWDTDLINMISVECLSINSVNLRLKDLSERYPYRLKSA